MAPEVCMVTDPADGKRALQNAPPEVSGFKVEHRDKDTQGVFVGRNEEEAELLEILRSNVKPQVVASTAPTMGLDQNLEQSGGKGIIIVAPPGAGKSTLLDHVLQKAKQDGMGVVQISHDALTTAKTLNEEIQSQEPWQSWIGEQSLPARLTDALASGADSIIGTLLKTAGDLGGLQINSENVEVCTRMLDGWRQNKTYSAKKLLQQIDRVYPDGFVFAIDEAQQLRRHLSHKRKCTSTVLNTLGAPNARRAAGISHGTIILAGLSDTENVVSEFGTLRQRIMYLPPIRPDAVAELIEVRIRSSGCTPVECDAALQAWCPPLVTEFGTWTHHAQCAAFAAQQVLAHFHRAALEADWGWPLVRRETLRGVRNLYAFVVKRAMNTVGTTHMHTVAHAMQCNDNYIAHDSMVGLVSRTERQRVADTTDTKMLVKDIIVAMLHAGLIEFANAPEQADVNELDDVGLDIPGGYRIGIPSVGRFITRTPPDDAMLERIVACGLRSLPPSETA